MVMESEKYVEYLVVDTTAFIQNAQLQAIGTNIVTCQEVVDEIKNKRQLRRLVVLPYDLVVKDVDPDYIGLVTEFTKKTGDYPSLSATDIKVMALTYQLEKEHVGTGHLHAEPLVQRRVNVITKKEIPDMKADITGFYVPKNMKSHTTSRTVSMSSGGEMDGEQNVGEKEGNMANTDVSKESILNKFESLNCENINTIEIEEGKTVEEVLASIGNKEVEVDEEMFEDLEDEDDDNDDSGWITPSNVQKAKKQINSELMEEKQVKVACITTDFAMQNVLKQMNLNVAALDGRIIKQLRTFVLRCYTCFGTTSIMTKMFCPKCGNKTLKRVAVSLNDKGEQVIHINAKHPLTARGKKYSLPTIKGGKHSNNPVLVADQPMPDQRPTRLARTKNNPLDDDYIAGYSPFVMRDVNSKSAQLKIRPSSEVKHWMKVNPNESSRRRRK